MAEKKRVIAAVIEEEKPHSIWHKLKWWVVIVVACLSVIGIPLAIWVWFRKIKKKRKVERIVNVEK